MAFFSLHTKDPLELFLNDNLAQTREGKPLPEIAGAATRIDRPPLWPEGVLALPAASVKASVAQNAGARPWDRDPIDQRIVRAALEGKGGIINSEQEVGGYPNRTATTAPFKPEAWDLDMLQRRVK